MQEKLALQKNKDIYWLLATHLFIFAFGPFASIVIILAWFCVIYRHQKRMTALNELLEDGCKSEECESK